jgi:Domain of unknown function (DUF397)
MEDTDLKWRKASYSSNGGAECVELASHDGRVMVRDTQDRSGPVLKVTSASWRELLSRVKDR